MKVCGMQQQIELQPSGNFKLSESDVASLSIEAEVEGAKVDKLANIDCQIMCLLLRSQASATNLLQGWKGRLIHRLTVHWRLEAYCRASVSTAVLDSNIAKFLLK